MTFRTRLRAAGSQQPPKHTLHAPCSSPAYLVSFYGINADASHPPGSRITTPRDPSYLAIPSTLLSGSVRHTSTRDQGILQHSRHGVEKSSCRSPRDHEEARGVKHSYSRIQRGAKRRARCLPARLYYNNEHPFDSKLCATTLALRDTASSLVIPTTNHLAR